MYYVYLLSAANGVINDDDRLHYRRSAIHTLWRLPASNNLTENMCIYTLFIACQIHILATRRRLLTASCCATSQVMPMLFKSWCLSWSSRLSLM